MRGKHIELFLVDGEPGGITTANISGWTGHILAGPRTALTHILKRAEAHSNGVYLLLGDDPDAIENVACYIGRTENFLQRFRQHDQVKEWWDRAVLVSSREDSFNEGHWGYLEARLVDIATSAKRCTLKDQIQTPKPRKLSEAQQSDAEEFLDQIQMVLPVLGVNILRSGKASPQNYTSPGDTDSPIFTLTVSKNNVKARAQVIGGEFIMLEGSHIIGKWDDVNRNMSHDTRSSYKPYRARHTKLVDDGSVAVDGLIGTLTRDIPFSSPSTAGIIATGRSCKGRTAWRWKGGTYGDWENRDLDSASQF